jgi:hypothetical protein
MDTMQTQKFPGFPSKFTMTILSVGKFFVSNGRITRSGLALGARLNYPRANGT